jgi:cholesterol oxidase
VFGHEGLVVADGSILPGPVGPNPSNTIAALAHRAAERLIEEAR